MKQLLLFFMITLSAQSLFASSYSQGVTRYMKRDYAEARKLLLAAVEQNKKNGNAYYYLGEIDKDNKDYARAIEYYLLALENNLNQKYVKLTYWNLIILTEQRHDMNATVKTCRIFYEKTGDASAKKKVDDLINQQLWSNDQKAVSHYESGKSLQAQGNQTEALKRFNAALFEDSSFLAARFEIGIDAYKKGDVDKAAQHLHKIADTIPFYTEAQLLMGKIYISENAYSTAKKYYSNVLEYGFISKSTRYTALLQRGRCNYKTGYLDNAEDDLTKALSIKSSSTPRFILSAIYIKQKNYDKALSILKQLNKQYPGRADITFQLGSVYYKKNDLLYVKQFESLFAAKGSSKNIPDKYYKAFLKLADYHHSIESHNKAAQVFAAIPEEKLDYKQKLHAAESCYFAGNYADSAKRYEKLSLSDKDKLMLARAYVKTGATLEAESVLQKLVISSPYKDEIHSDILLKPIASSILKKHEEKLAAETKSQEEESTTSTKPETVESQPASQ